MGRALRVPPRDWVATAHAAVLFVAAEVLLRTLPVARVARWFGVPVATGLPLGDGEGGPGAPLVLSDRDRRRLRGVTRISRRLYPAERGCLRRCLVVGRLLRHHEPRMRIGARRGPEGGFAAHAWLELPGAPSDLDRGYVPFSAGLASGPAPGRGTARLGG